MKISNAVIIDKITEILRFLSEKSDVIINHCNNKEVNTIQLFCLTMIRRLNESCFSLAYLFEILRQNEKVEFSIGVQSRVLIADSLISMDLFRLITSLENEGSGKIETELKNLCDIYLSDGLQHTVSYHKDNKDYEFKSKEETDLAYKSIVIRFENFFKTYSSEDTNPILKFSNKEISEVTNVKKIFKRLANSEHFKNIASIYEDYAYFSKYDHFGIMYLNFANNDIERKLDIYSKSVEIFSMHFYFILTILKLNAVGNEIITEAHKDVKQYCENMLSCTYGDFNYFEH